MESQTTKPNQSDYPDWHYQPLRLLKEEIANPMGVIKEFFSTYHLPEARKHLKEMLEDAMCNVEVYAINYLTIYDDIEKLMEAAWLILQREKEKNNTAESKALEEWKQPLLKDVLWMLRATIRPERIFLLQQKEDIFVDLLIVVPDTFTKPFSHYETIIETAYFGIRDFSYSLMQAHALKQHIEEGHLFYVSACTEEKQVYSSSPLDLPQIPAAKKEELRAAAKEQFTGCMERAVTFFEGAKTYYESGNDRMALFMLHQASELSFRAIILVLTGYEVKEHRIEVLKKHTRRCAPELNKLFPADTEKEKALLSLLESAYLKARYTDNFTADTEDVLLLLDRVQQLQAVAQDSFVHIMDLLL